MVIEYKKGSEENKKVIELIREHISKGVFKLVVTSEPEDYLDLIVDILSMAAKEKGMNAVYVTYTRPFNFLNKLFEENNIKNVYFVDCITESIDPGVGSSNKSNKVVFISTQTALEELTIGVHKLLRTSREKGSTFIIFDSLTTAAIYISGENLKRLLKNISDASDLGGFGCIILSPKLEKEDTIRALAENCGFFVISKNKQTP